MRRTKKPSMYRFVGGTAWAAFVIVVAVALRHIESGICGLTQLAHTATCSVVPPFFYQGTIIVSLVGCAYSAYRAYCDFCKGDYYLDCAEAGYL